jgi:hypothetical protein
MSRIRPRLRPRDERGQNGRTETEEITVKYLLLKHYGGGATPVVECAPMDQWTPEEISAHIRFMEDFGKRLEGTGELADAQGLSPEGTRSCRRRSPATASASTRRRPPSPPCTPTRGPTPRPTGRRSSRGTTSSSGSPTTPSSGSTARSRSARPTAGLAALAEVDDGVPRHAAVAAYLHERAGDLDAAARLYAAAARAAPSEEERSHLTRQAARLNAGVRLRPA